MGLWHPRRSPAHCPAVRGEAERMLDLPSPRSPQWFPRSAGYRPAPAARSGPGSWLEALSEPPAGAQFVLGTWDCSQRVGATHGTREGPFHLFGPRSLPEQGLRRKLMKNQSPPLKMIYLCSLFSPCVNKNFGHKLDGPIYRVFPAAERNLSVVGCNPNLGARECLRLKPKCPISGVGQPIEVTGAGKLQGIHAAGSCFTTSGCFSSSIRYSNGSTPFSSALWIRLMKVSPARAPVADR